MTRPECRSVFGQFGPWSLQTFKKRPKWPKTEVTKDRSGGPCNYPNDGEGRRRTAKDSEGRRMTANDGEWQFKLSRILKI